MEISAFYRMIFSHMTLLARSIFGYIDSRVTVPKLVRDAKGLGVSAARLHLHQLGIIHYRFGGKFRRWFPDSRVVRPDLQFLPQTG